MNFDKEKIKAYLKGLSVENIKSYLKKCRLEHVRTYTQWSFLFYTILMVSTVLVIQGYASLVLMWLIFTIMISLCAVGKSLDSWLFVVYCIAMYYLVFIYFHFSKKK